MKYSSFALVFATAYEINAPMSTRENLSNKRTLVTLAVTGFVVRVTLALVLAGLALF